MRIVDNESCRQMRYDGETPPSEFLRESQSRLEALDRGRSDGDGDFLRDVLHDVVDKARHGDDLVPSMSEYILQHPSGRSVHVRRLAQLFPVVLVVESSLL